MPAANDNLPSPRAIALPYGVAPRGLSRVEAAAWVGVSTTTFDEMVRDGRMPQPKPINSRVIWDRYLVDDAFAALPERTSANPWDCD